MDERRTKASRARIQVEFDGQSERQGELALGVADFGVGDDSEGAADAAQEQLVPAVVGGVLGGSADGDADDERGDAVEDAGQAHVGEATSTFTQGTTR